MIKNSFIIAVLFIFLLNTSSWSQDETLYLSTCHNAYFPGEDINLKIWRLFDKEGQEKERFVFTELLSSSNEIISRKIVECGREGAALIFRVPDAIPSGFYLIRAYTSEMMNLDDSYFAYRKIMILNPAIDNKFPFPQRRSLSGKTIRADFFPVGGNIVSGLVNRIYVKFENLPAGALDDAYVLSSYDDTLSTLVEVDSKTARFDFVPYAGEYEIRMPSIFPHRKITIPAALPSAYSLKYAEGLDQIRFIVSKNDTSLDFQNLRIKIENDHSEETRFLALKDEMNLEINDLLPGLNRFSLVSETDSVLSENYYLKKEEGGISIKYLAPGSEFKSRQKVTFQIQVSSAQVNPDNITLNVFVRNAGQELLSNPGLKEYFSYRNYMHLEPEWNPVNPDQIEALGVIYGPEIFRNNSKTNNSDNHIEQDQYLLNGRFYDGNTSNLNIFLSFPGDSSQLFISRTDSAGHFSFPIRSAYGERELFIKSEDSLSKGFISVEERFFDDPSGISNYPSSFDSLQRNYLDRLYQKWLLEQVYNENDAASNNIKVRPPMYYDEADFYLSMDNYVELPNMEEVFFEIVKPVMILRENRRPYLKVIDRNTNRTIGERPLYVIDGVPFTNPQIAFGLNPVNVRDIAIVARKYFIGTESWDGIIIINTRANNLSDVEPGMVYLRQNYIFPEKEVWIHMNPEPALNHKPFSPSTIFWNSNLNTGRDGKASFSFVTPDIPGSYEIWVEGIDTKTGLPGVNSYIFTVSDN